MTVAIFIPTLYRPQNIARLVESIEETTVLPYSLYFMCPRDDTETQEAIAKTSHQYWVDFDDMRFVKRIQYMYEHTSEEWFLTGADDLVFKYGWLERALMFKDEFSVISFNDRCNESLPGTNFLIKRSYIENQSGVIDSPNTVFHQGYFHNFCDNELVATAKNRDTFIKCCGVIEHYHPTVGKSAWDGVYEIAQNNFHNDAAIFNYRAANVL